jgi:hypothetical protein
MSVSHQISKAPKPTHGFFMNTLHLLAPFVTRRNLARIASTFMSAVIIVIRPFDRLSGNKAFLLFTVKELVFSVQETLAQQLEATVLNLMGATAGIFLSTLARAIADRFPFESLEARAVCAVFLISIAFFGAWISVCMLSTLMVYPSWMEQKSPTSTDVISSYFMSYFNMDSHRFQ